jgi:peptidyl-prolyl cis-trans isomerase C
MNLIVKHGLAGTLMLGSLLQLATLALTAKASAAEYDPAEIIAHQGDVVLSQVEIDAAFSKLAPEERLRFIRDGAKVDQLIRALLKRKVIAADAAKMGFDQDALIAARMQLEAQRELADAWLQKLLSEMPEADYETLAHEDYLANPDRYRSAPVLDVSHILIGTSDRSVAEARAIAQSLEARLQADPARFDELVTEYSDDPAKINNEGRYREMRPGMMAAPFEKAAFALQEPGDISDPVLTDYGFHIIRLNGRSGNELQEFSAVKEEAMAEARQRHLDSYRESYYRRVLSDPIVVPEGAVEIMARRHFGENLELAPGGRQ